MKRKIELLVVTLMAVAIAGCGTSYVPVEVGSVIPDVALPCVAGSQVGEDEISLSSYPGKVMVVNFWSTTCAQCLSEIDDLKRISVETNAQVIGVALDGDEQPVRDVVKQKQIHYPVLLGGQEIFERFDGYAIPYTIVIDGARKLRRKITGKVEYEELAKAIEEVGVDASGEAT